MNSKSSSPINLSAAAKPWNLLTLWSQYALEQITVDVAPSHNRDNPFTFKQVLFLGSIPIDSKVDADSDKGSPFVVEHPDSPAAKAFTEIVSKVRAYLKEKTKSKPD